MMRTCRTSYGKAVRFWHPEACHIVLDQALPSTSMSYRDGTFENVYRPLRSCASSSIWTMLGLDIAHLCTSSEGSTRRAVDRSFTRAASVDCPSFMSRRYT
jgi:hypothetical protein